MDSKPSAYVPTSIDEYSTRSVFSTAPLLFRLWLVRVSTDSFVQPPTAPYRTIVFVLYFPQMTNEEVIALYLPKAR